MPAEATQGMGDADGEQDTDGPADGQIDGGTPAQPGREQFQEVGERHRVDAGERQS